MRAPSTSFRTYERGIALISVLLVFALVAILIASISLKLNSSLQRSSGIIETSQAYLLCLSGEEIARQILTDDFKKNGNVDHLHEKWATYNKSIDVTNGYIEIDIVDAQSFFNLNNLVLGTGMADASAKKDFSTLLNYTFQDTSLSDDIANQAVDWIDSDKAGTAEDSDYSFSDPPYKTPDMPITHISELRLLKDMNKERYWKFYSDIAPAITVLPERTMLNINTVNPAVLGALASINIQQARQIVTAIRNKSDGFSSVSEVMQIIPPNLHASLLPKVTVSTSYFEVRVRAKFGDHYAFLTSLLYRDASNAGNIHVVSRDRSQRYIFPYSKDYNDQADSDLLEIDI